MCVHARDSKNVWTWKGSGFAAARLFNIAQSRELARKAKARSSAQEGARRVPGLWKLSPNGYGDDCSKGSGNADGGDVGRRHQGRGDTRGACATESDTRDPCPASPEAEAVVRATEEAPAVRAGRHDRILV